MLRAITDSLLSLAYPQECRLCSGVVSKHSNGVACEKCWAETRFFSGNEMLCNKCGAFFSDQRAPVAVLCHKCDDHHYDKATAAGIYEKGIAASILSLKTTPRIPSRLAAAVENSAQRLSDPVDLIVPIPLSKARHLERGFNQAEFIAGLVAKAVCAPVDSLTLQRKKHTPIHRIGMDQRARELTVEKAFEAVRPNFIQGKKILLVDDVLTSGSTASACAKVLKKNGAASVDVFTVARAVLH